MTIAASLMVALGGVRVEALSMPSTGLRLWLKADAITGLNDGDPVTTWPDSSPYATSVVKGDPVGPTWKTNILNGKPVVRFDGITNYLASGTFNTGGDDLTMFIVARTNGVNTGGYQTLFIGGVSSYGATGSLNFWQLYADSAGVLQINFLTPATLKINTGVKPSATSFQILCLSKSNTAPGSSEVFTNGTSVGTGTGTVTLATAGKCYIGSWNKNDMNGDIAEIVLYNTNLGTTDRQLVEGLLAWKYGLQGDLPAAHPWKNADPALAPTIANGTPAFVTSTGATLVGTLSSGAYPMTVSVFWGTADAGHPTNGLWQHTNTFTWSSGSAPGTNVTLPTPNVSYFYRFYATNDYGDSYAPDAASFYASDSITWIQAATGTHYWTNAANWSPAVVPNSAGVIAVITNARAGAQTINVGQAITLGQLVVGSTSTVTIAKLTGGSFLFDNGSVNPRISALSTNATLSTDVPITYGSASGVEVTNESSVTLNGTVGGFSNLVKYGGATLTMTAVNTFTGDLIIKDGAFSCSSSSGVVPDTAIIQVEGNSTFAMARTDVIKGARGIGWVRYNGGAVNGKLIMGTNTASASANGYTYVVDGGVLDPGFGATIGNLVIAGNTSGGDPGWIVGGDIYIDVASASSNDKITFWRSGGAGSKISGGNLHLNFLSGYMPTNGTTWDVVICQTSGTITDPNGANIFDRIDSNLSGFGLTAEIVSGNTVRINALRRGTLIQIR